MMMTTAVLSLLGHSAARLLQLIVQMQAAVSFGPGCCHVEGAYTLSGNRSCDQLLIGMQSWGTPRRSDEDHTQGHISQSSVASRLSIAAIIKVKSREVVHILPRHKNPAVR